ncbi:MAG: L-seryl-tRNA(Sec) selenium transferase [Gemmatimonadaceae bacterium]
MDARRSLPSVTALIELDAVQAMRSRQSHSEIVDAARCALAEVRDGRAHFPVDAGEWGDRVAASLAQRSAPALRRVINATGVVLHTNLGRAPLATAAVAAIRAIAEDYCDVEYDVASGSRGSRHAHCVELLRQLTGAADAMVVNNCAAALTLALRALAGGGTVAISRGELVEIGGSFRVPEVMQVAGVQLVEVGTTNRTHMSDYVSALNGGAAAVVKVHRSNFRVEGFTAEVSVAELAQLCADRGVPLIHDFGSGLMLSLDRYGLSGEPTAADAVRSGATITVMSGDKLLGGPQAGIVLGDMNAVDTMRRDPLARAVRTDKLTIAALAATLQLYRDEDHALESIPALRMLTISADQLQERAGAVVDRLRHAGVIATTVACDGAVGAGAFPTTSIPSFGVATAGDAEEIAAALRLGAVPVVGRIRNDAFVLNLRSVPERDDDLLGDTVATALG